MALLPSVAVPSYPAPVSAWQSQYFSVGGIIFPGNFYEDPPGGPGIQQGWAEPWQIGGAPTVGDPLHPLIIPTTSFSGFSLQHKTAANFRLAIENIHATTTHTIYFGKNDIEPSTVGLNARLRIGLAGIAPLTFDESVLADIEFGFGDGVVAQLAGFDGVYGYTGPSGFDTGLLTATVPYATTRFDRSEPTYENLFTAIDAIGPGGAIQFGAFCQMYVHCLQWPTFDGFNLYPSHEQSVPYNYHGGASLGGPAYTRLLWTTDMRVRFYT